MMTFKSRCRSKQNDFHIPAIITRFGRCELCRARYREETGTGVKQVCS